MHDGLIHSHFSLLISHFRTRRLLRGELVQGAADGGEEGVATAVAGLTDVHRRLHTGQRIRVDGATGKVSILSDSSRT